MNNKYLSSKYIVPIIAALILMYILIPKYDFTYYKLPPEGTYVTKVEYSSIFKGNYTYFTAGKYNKWAIPENFVHPVYSGWTGAYDVFLSSTNGNIKIYGFNGYFETANLSNYFSFEKVSTDRQGSKQWASMKTRPQKYIYVSSGD